MAVKNVTMGSVHSFAHNNVAREEGKWFTNDQDRLNLALLLVPGWVNDKGLTSVMPMNDTEIAQAISEREAERAALVAVQDSMVLRVEGKKIELFPCDIVAAWDRLYKNGDGFTIPKYARLSCFRRGASLPYMLAITAKLGLPGYTRLDVTILDEPTELEKITATMTENEKEQGRKYLSELERLRGGYAMFRAGASDPQMRAALNSVGQKIHGICLVNRMFPEEHLIEKILDGRIAFGPINKTDVCRAGKNAKLTREQVYEIFTPVKAADEPRRAKNKDCDLLMEQTEVEVVGMVLEAIKTNRLGDLAKLDKIRHELNDVMAKHGLSWTAPAIRARMEAELSHDPDNPAPPPLTESSEDDSEA